MISVDVKNAHILITDNEKSSSELLESILKKAGYTDIQKASAPIEILELHHRDPFDLILLDLDSLGETGFQLMNSLRSRADIFYQCAIILSSDARLKLRALQSGARDFISKPFAQSELEAIIQNALKFRLIYNALEKEIVDQKQQFEVRTSLLEESEARFRGFTDLASDWYWEQDSAGKFTKTSGPVPKILGIEVDSSAETTNTLLGTGWNAHEQSILRGKITAREPFLDFEFSRSTVERGQQTFLVSGQPMFDRTCNFLGYRGIGVEISARKKH